MILECSSKGDKRFSAFYAKVEVFGKYDSIENHYQLCKRFGDFVPKSWKEAKGKKPTHIEIDGVSLDLKYLTPFYEALWCKYLDNNPDLVEYARKFDDYNDMFKGKSLNCQADVIRKYIKQGREQIINDCKEFFQALENGGDKIMTIRVVNIRNYIPRENEIFIKVDRSSVLGNPFYMKHEGMRDEVCDKYQEYFDNMRNKDKQFQNAIENILNIAKSHNVALACWCAPKRCHAETIKKYIDNILRGDR